MVKWAGLLCIVGLWLLSQPCWSQSCYYDGSEGLLLPPLPVSSFGMCPPGYYCPNSTFADFSSWPRLCPPAPACIALRQKGQLCDPQGPFEPSVCPVGMYCPTNFVQLPCPEGYACNLGTNEPVKCGPLVHCPSGSAVPYDFSGLLLTVLCVVFVLFTFSVYTRRYRGRRRRGVSPSGVGDEDAVGGWSTMSASRQSILLDAISESRGTMEPVNIHFENLGVTIPPNGGAPAKTVLRGCSGKFEAGRVTAVMGPSGAGKTVLFSAVLGKIDPSWSTEGTISVCGYNSVKPLRHVFGYVPQDDVLHSELTVYDHVWYNSEVRMNRTWTADRREAVRGAVLNALSLSAVADTFVGDPEHKGVSGGQRKRVSIALELCSAPQAIFLDEPTTGLDSYTSLEVCRVLKEIAAASRLTVVMVIHQPRIEIWNELDQVLFLAPGGSTVFEGPRSRAEEYFGQHLGLDFAKGNPPDIILDGITRHKERCMNLWALNRERQVGEGLAAAVKGDLSPQRQGGVIPKANSSTFFQQVQLYHIRSLVKQLEAPWNLFSDILLSSALAAFMASAAIRKQMMGLLQAPYSLINPKPSVNVPPMVCMFYAIAISAVVPVRAIQPFGNERRQFWREASTGHMNRLAYYLGTMTAQSYRIFLSSLHFTIIVYFMWNPVLSFWDFFAMLFLTFACTDAQSVALGLVVKPRSAPMLVSIAAVFVALLNGYAQVPVLGFAAYSWYMTEAVFTRYVEPLAGLWDVENTMQSFVSYTFGQFGFDVGMMIMFLVMYYAASLTALLLLNRDKQR